MVQQTVSCLEPSPKHQMTSHAMSGNLAFSAHPGATYPLTNTTGRERPVPGLCTTTGKPSASGDGFGPGSGAGSGTATMLQSVNTTSSLLQRFYLAQEVEAATAGAGPAGARVEFHDLMGGEDGGESPGTRSREATLARMPSLMLGSRRGTFHEKDLPQPHSSEPTDWEDGECMEGERMADWLNSQMQLIPSSAIKASLDQVLVAAPAPAPVRTRPSRISFDREAVDNYSPSNFADMRYTWLGSRQGSVAVAPRRVSFDQVQETAAQRRSARRWRRLRKNGSQGMSEEQQQEIMERRRSLLGSRHGSTSWRVGEGGFAREDNAGASQRMASLEEIAC